MTRRSTSQGCQSIGVSRGIRYARIVPMSLLAAFYGILSVNWIANAVDHFWIALNGDWMRGGLATVHATSTGVFYAVVAAIMFVRKEPIRRERRIVSWVLPFVAVLGLGAIGSQDAGELSPWMWFVSTAIVLLGTGYTLYALRHLGRHFGVVADVRGLVTSGPYRIVRHPLYLGETATSVGVLLAVLSPYTIAAFSIALAAQLWRAKLEEQSIAHVFPTYREYAARTPMLIPFVKLSVWSRKDAVLSSSSGD